MKNSVFSGLLILAGAILIASTEIADHGSMGVFVGAPLMLWGILERVIPAIQKYYREKQN